MVGPRGFVPLDEKLFFCSEECLRDHFDKVDLGKLPKRRRGFRTQLLGTRPQRAQCKSGDNCYNEAMAAAADPRRGPAGLTEARSLVSIAGLAAPIRANHE